MPRVAPASAALVLLSLFPFAAPASAQSGQGQPTEAAAPAGLDPQAATALLERACKVMLALPSGGFTSDIEMDSAIGRGSGMPMRAGDNARIRGGWHGDRRWGDTEDDTFVVRGDRMVSKTKDGWKLRRRTLASGNEAPFLLSPRLLFEVLQSLPAAARQVQNVEADEQRGAPVQIVSLRLSGDAARDLALSGALPEPAGGMFFPGGGMFGGGPPKMTYTIDMALSIDPATGQVLRMRSKTYEDNPVLANVRIQFGPGGDESDPPQDEDDGDEAAGGGAVQWKKGLPIRKPGKTESVAYYRVDFKDLGEATAPEVDSDGSRWLGDQ